MGRKLTRLTAPYRPYTWLKTILARVGRRLISLGETAITNTDESRILAAYSRKIDGLLEANEEKLSKLHIPSSLTNEIAHFLQDDCLGLSDSRWHKFYMAANGIQSSRYIPEDLFYAYIERHLNDQTLAKAYADKNLYDRILPRELLPVTVLRKIRGRFYNSDYQIMDQRWARSALLKYDNQQLVLKPSLNTGGGRGVIVNTADSLIDHLDNCQDYLVQESVEQYAPLSALHPQSVNTLRCMTLQQDSSSAQVVSVVLRMGRGGARVDNQAAGGISAGISGDGKVKSVAYDKQGNRFDRHPDSGIIFSEIEIPNFISLVKLCCHLHALLPYFELISWDIAIDTSLRPILLEFNISDQEINFHQLNNGPLFGSLTSDVLDNWRKSPTTTKVTDSNRMV